MRRKYEELFRRCEDRGVDGVTGMAALCGLARPVMSGRLNGRSQWQMHEIATFVNAGILDKREIPDFFFPQLVETTAQDKEPIRLQIAGGGR